MLLGLFTACQFGELAETLLLGFFIVCGGALLPSTLSYVRHSKGYYHVVVNHEVFTHLTPNDCISVTDGCFLSPTFRRSFRVLGLNCWRRGRGEVHQRRCPKSCTRWLMLTSSSLCSLPLLLWLYPFFFVDCMRRLLPPSVSQLLSSTTCPSGVRWQQVLGPSSLCPCVMFSF